MSPSTNFPLPLRGDLTNKGRRITLFAPFIYSDPEKEILVEVPAGFISDFNSVPFGLWNLLPPWEYPEAGVVHDWLYKHPKGFYRGPKRDEVCLTRSEVDDIHRRILHLEGASWPKRQAMWAGIRVGGWRPWNRYRKDPVLTDAGKGEPLESIVAPTTKEAKDASSH